jgi:hypothetical protein
MMFAPAGADGFAGAASQQSHHTFQERPMAFLNHLRALAEMVNVLVVLRPGTMMTISGSFQRQAQITHEGVEIVD